MYRRWLAGVAAFALLGGAQAASAQNAETNGAAADRNAVAVSADEAIADDGSNVIVGNKNRAAAANQGGAAVAGSGLAIGASDNTVTGEKNTAVFGQGNVVATPHVEQIIPSWDGYGEGGPKVDTGSITDQSIGELKGTNFIAGNTGLVNQGAPTGIAADNSFNKSGALGTQGAAAPNSNGPGAVGPNKKSIALSAGEEVADDGSNAIIGNGNKAAAANQGGAAVGGDGTALGFYNNKVEGDDSTVVFGADNVVATAHLSQVIGQVGGDARAADVNGGFGAGDLLTGDIRSVSVSSATGANRIQMNTGVGNQAAPLSIAAKMSFN